MVERQRPEQRGLRAAEEREEEAEEVEEGVEEEETVLVEDGA